MRSTTSLCAGLLALLTFPVAQADAIGVYVSADYWQYDGKADVAQTGKQKSSFLFEQQNQARSLCALNIQSPCCLMSVYAIQLSKAMTLKR